MHQRYVIYFFLLIVGLSHGCGGGDSSSQSPADNEVEHDGGVAQSTVMVETVSEREGDNCPTGGVALVSGTDSNRNNTLDESEISNTLYVCNGSDGANGVAGTEDVANLVATNALTSGDSHCPDGGIEINIGGDDDGNGELDVAEVEETQYICNGSDGADSARMMMSTRALSLGDENCEAGGIAFNYGIDSDGNGELDSDEIDDTSYVCNGVDETGSITCLFPWYWSSNSLRCERSSDWSEADLSGRSFTGEYLAGIDLTDATLVGTDLSWTELRGADLSGADLSDADLGSASVDGANFTNVVFDGADLSGVDFRGATITDATGTDLEACPAHLPNDWNCFSLGSAGLTLLGPDMVLSGLDLTGADLSGFSLNGLQVINLVGCPAKLPANWFCLDLPATGNTLVGSRANLSGLDLTDADFSTASNLNHINFNDSTLTGATFANNANLQDATFNNATVTNVTFGTNTDLEDAIFTGADLTDTVFGTGTDLKDARLSGANLSGVALSGTQLDGVSATDLVTCPTNLPMDWSCLALSTTGNTLVGPEANLNGLDLTGANFTGLDLSDASFDDTDLTNSVLTGADLDNVDLDSATLTGVTASDLVNCPDQLPDDWDCIRSTLVGPGANLAGLDFSGADLSGTELQGAILTNADLTDADLSDADLTGADLTNATLNTADLNDADLADATLTGVAATGLQDCPDTLPTGWECIRSALMGPGADLTDVDSDLVDANLSDINLQQADLTGADLTNIDLSGADLSNANLTNVDLTDADLTDADLTDATLTGITWDNTTCPDGSNSDSNGNTCVGNL